LLHSASQREGGVMPALSTAARKLSDAISRLTGANITPAQAAFLAAAAALLLWASMGGALPWGGGGGGDSAYGSRSSSSYSDRHSHSRRRTSEGSGYGGGYGGGGGNGGGGYGGGYGDGGGYLGFGSGVDFSFLLGVGMLGSYVWRLGGGGRPGGWTVGNFVRGVQNLDFFQMMMLMNLVQNVLGGRRRGMPGGFGRRMYY